MLKQKSFISIQLVISQQQPLGIHMVLHPMDGVLQCKESRVGEGGQRVQVASVRLSCQEKKVLWSGVQAGLLLLGTCRQKKPNSSQKPWRLGSGRESKCQNQTIPSGSSEQQGCPAAEPSREPLLFEISIGSEPGVGSGATLGGELGLKPSLAFILFQICYQ